MSVARQLIIVLAVIVAAPAYAAKPEIQWNKDYDFSAVKTFQWQTPQTPSLEQTDPFLHRTIVDAIENGIKEVVGWTEVQANPDVLVTYHTSSRTDVRLDSDSFGYTFGGYGLGRWGRYGYAYAPPPMTTNRVVTEKKGTLVVDIVDAKSKELVWRGSAADIAVSENSGQNQKAARKAINAMAKQTRKLKKRHKR